MTVEVKIFTATTQEEIEWVYKQLRKNDPIACDVETDWFDWRKTKLLSIGFSWKLNTGVSVPLYHKETKVSADINTLRDILVGKQLIFHNAKFDLQQLWAHGVPVKAYFDTMLAHYVAIDETRGTQGLKYLAKSELNYEYGDVHELLTHKKKTFETIPLAMLLPYNANDAAVTFMLYELYKDKVPEIFYDLLMPVTDTLARMEMRGVKLNVDLLVKIRTSLREVVKVTRAEIEKKFGINPNSTKQVLAYFRRSGVKIEHADKWELGAIAKENEAARLILDFRKSKKLTSTYTSSLLKKLDENQYLPTSYLLHGTVTGRLASTGPNLQNIPRKSMIRDVFIPSEGFQFVEADYSQIEMRIAAVLADEDKLLEAFNDNRDIHNEFGKAIFRTEKVSKEQRVEAKMITFGILYGRREASIAQELDISYEGAKKILNSFFNAFPKLRDFTLECERLAKTRGWIESASGRKRRFHGEETVRKAVNFPLQSLASDMTLKSLVVIDKLFRQLDLLSRPVLTVHDSILFEVPPFELALATRVIKRVMERIPFKYLPNATVKFPANISVGTTWSNVKPYVFFKDFTDHGQLKLIDDALIFKIS